MLHPLLTEKTSDVAPLKQIVLCMFSWNDESLPAGEGAAELPQQTEETTPADQVEPLSSLRRRSAEGLW